MQEERYKGKSIIIRNGHIRNCNHIINTASLLFKGYRGTEEKIVKTT